MFKHFFCVFIFSSTVLGLLKPIDQNTVAVYWGQNALMQTDGPTAQQRLSFYCENSSIDLILVSFLTSLNNQVVNFASSTNFCQPMNGTDLVYCPQIEEDIIKCQMIFGKTIILSIGGATYNESGFSSVESANTAADKVWANFGPLTKDVTTTRPFGEAVVDGFDFDFEEPTPNLLPFASRLQSLMNESMKSEKKKYFLTAAPQCPFPDKNFGPLLDGSILFDAIWVQFYNNYCGANSFLPGNSSQLSFNFATWDTWAQNTFPSHDVQIMLGIPGGVNVSNTGYISHENLTSVIQYSSTFPSFGGVMIWEMTALYENKGFLNTVLTAINLKNPSRMKSNIQPKISSNLNQTFSSTEVVIASDASAIYWPIGKSWLFYISTFLSIISYS